MDMKHLAAVSIALLTLVACRADAAPKLASGEKMSPMPTVKSPSGKTEVAILAGGCFWGMENVMRGAKGILSMEVGYAGGKNTNVSYEDVSEGDTGHAESVRVVFDPAQISYADLLTHWYFRGHDPTSLDRQNNDVGTQYRSEIFATSPEQAKVAKDVIVKIDATKKWGKPIVTKIEPASTFIKAEGYHQDYLIKNPNGYNDHFLRKFDF
ncbi:peptide-methionine (S)-S-oxide reductase MsrA [soil metagenome]